MSRKFSGLLRKLFHIVPLIAVLLTLGGLSFAATAHAAVAVTGDDFSALDALYKAFRAHQYSLAGAVFVVLLVAAIRRYLGDYIKFLHTDAGGAVLALLGSAAAAAVTGLTANGATLSWPLVSTALMIGFTAMGGYAALKTLFFEPILVPLQARAPAWLKPFLGLITWVFEHPEIITELEPAAPAPLIPATPVQGATP